MAIKKNQDDFLEDLINPLSELFEKVNSDVLSVITRRIKSIGTMTATDAHKLSILIRNKDIKEIERIISDGTDLSIKQIDKILTESASYNDDLADSLYKARNIQPSTILTDSALLNVVRTAKENIVDNVVNLSKTTGFMLNGKMTDTAKAYNYAVNRAVFEAEQGLFDYNTAIRSVIKQMADSGVRTVDYDSGYHRRMDSAVRMNVLDGVRNMNMNYRETQGKQFGADGVEISAHGLCAVDHQNVQGRQYSNKEFEKLQESLDRPIGSLNCKHSITPIILGISNPVYSDETLQEYKANSNKKVEYSTLQKDSDGKTIKNSLSRYDASQKMRQVETNIRQLKDVRNQLSLNNDKIGVAEYDRKIKAKTAYYKKIANEIGLKPQLDRLRVYGPK
jgi:hypothetical protein